MKALILALLFISVDLVAQDFNNSEDSLYVWARNGLNVRSGPGTSFDIVAKLTFGDKVRHLSDSENTYNIKTFSNIDTNYYRYRTENIQPYIMYGHWVKILLDNGTPGFAISQYLLDIIPTEAKSYNVLPIKLTVTDTIKREGVGQDFEFTNFSIEYNYVNNIVSTESYCSGGVATIIEFPGLSMDEAIIILGLDQLQLILRRNWRKELMLAEIDGLCDMKFVIKKSKIVYRLCCFC